MRMTLHELWLKSMSIKSNHEKSSGKSHLRDTPQNVGSVLLYQVDQKQGKSEELSGDMTNESNKVSSIGSLERKENGIRLKLRKSK